MNWRALALLYAGFAASSAGTCHGQAAPAEVAPAPALDSGQVVTVAWLGVAVSEVDLKKGAENGLPAYHGLEVDYVDPDSPAGQCGIQKDDVLVKLDDQWLVLERQLAVLVRARQPGEEVKVTLHRDKHPMVLATKLGSQTTSKQDLAVAANTAFTAELLRQMDAQAKVAGPVNQSDNRYALIDGETSILIEPRDGSPHLTVRDNKGELVVDSPLITKEHLDAIPPAIQKKLDPLFQLAQGRVELKVKLEPPKSSAKARPSPSPKK